MNRRAFVVGLGGLGAIWPLACHAQSPPDDALSLLRKGLPVWGAWKQRPSIVAISREDDPRLIAISQAVNFWNAELLKLDISFRLGPVSRMVGLLPANNFHLSPGSARHNPFNMPEHIRNIDGDVIVVLSDGDFSPFTTGWLRPKKLIVEIPSEQTYPLTVPNGAAYVIAHEFGHVIGLGHSGDTNALMCGSSPWCHFSFPAQGILPLSNAEKTQLIEMYPPNSQDDLMRRWKQDPLREQNAG